jgi:hypothetical protein
MKISAFEIRKKCGLVETYRDFAGTCYHHLQDGKITNQYRQHIFRRRWNLTHRVEDTTIRCRQK